MEKTLDAIKTFFGFTTIPDDFEPLASAESTPQVPKSELNPRQFSFSEITIESPKSYEDSTKIATHLLENKPVIINLRHLEPDIHRRLIDFMCGTAYAIQGHMMKVGDSIFLFTPANVSISKPDSLNTLGSETPQATSFLNRDNPF